MSGDYFGLSGDQIYSKYFREGPYTHLWLPPVKTLQNGAREVKWKYTFSDLGMNFEVERHFIVLGETEILDLQTGLWSTADGAEDLQGKIFDHYRSYLSGLYESLGLSVKVS